jgi:adenylate cyclase
LQKINIELTKKNKPNINIGIGINTGLSVVGEMGSYGRSDYTCIGDAVNLASRLEGLCKPYGTRIIISEFTYKRLKLQEYFLRELDIVQVKGKTEPVTIYECMGNKTDNWVKFNENDSKLYMQALQLYRDSQFEKALKIFKQLYEAEGQKLYALYMERCEYYIKNGVQNFNGVFTFVTK